METADKAQAVVDPQVMMDCDKCEPTASKLFSCTVSTTCKYRNDSLLRLKGLVEEIAEMGQMPMLAGITYLRERLDDDNLQILTDTSITLERRRRKGVKS